MELKKGWERAALAQKVEQARVRTPKGATILPGRERDVRKFKNDDRMAGRWGRKWQVRLRRALIPLSQ